MKISKKVQAFILQLLCFATLFIATRFLVEKYTTLNGFWIPFSAFVVGTIFAPKFQAVTSQDGEKLFMRWVFLKGMIEIGK
jgi:hypothetical protein